MNKPTKNKSVPSFSSRPLDSEFQLSQNNHFKFGYDGVAYEFRKSKTQQWWVSYGDCSRKVKSWKEECIIAANQIRSITDREIWICMSGGIDSEVVAESFRLAGIRIRGAILQFEDNLNEHDVFWAKRYCHRFEIPYEIFNFNLLKFWEGGDLYSIAAETQCVSPQFPSTMKLMEIINQKGGFPILGSAECYLEKINGNWVMYEREKVAALYRFLIARNIPGNAGFFQWNPEIMYSFLTDPKMTDLLNCSDLGHSNTYRTKPEIYAQHFEFARRKKYTGFENVMDRDAFHRATLHKMFPDSDQVALIPATELISHLAGTQNPRKVLKNRESSQARMRFQPSVTLMELASIE